MRNIKKKICLCLTIAFMLNIINVQMTFSQETVMSGQTEITETENFEANEIEVTEDVLITEAPAEEAAVDIIKEEKPSEENTQYDIIALDENEYLAYGIKTRDLEVTVTDGYDPVANAEVTVCGQMVQ